MRARHFERAHVALALPRSVLLLTASARAPTVRARFRGAELRRDKAEAEVQRLRALIPEEQQQKKQRVVEHPAEEYWHGWDLTTWRGLERQVFHAAVEGRQECDFKLVRPRGLPQKRQQMDRKKKQKRNEQRLEIELPDLKERLKLDRELDQDTRKVIENA